MRTLFTWMAAAASLTEITAAFAADVPGYTTYDPSHPTGVPDLPSKPRSRQTVTATSSFADSSIGILGRVQLEGAGSKDIVRGSIPTRWQRRGRLFAPHGTNFAGRILPVDFSMMCSPSTGVISPSSTTRKPWRNHLYPCRNL